MAREFLAAIARGEAPTATEKKLTFGEFIKDNYEPWVLENRKPGDATAYIIKYNFSFLFNTPMEEINIDQVDKWKSKKGRVKGFNYQPQAYFPKSRSKLGGQTEYNRNKPAHEIGTSHRSRLGQQGTLPDTVRKNQSLGCLGRPRKRNQAWTRES